MRVLIAAGGTGGHIYPGIAVAKELLQRDPESIVRFVGTRGKIEERLVPAAGFELSLIESAGLKNMGLAGKLRGGLLLPKSLFAARRLVREFKPDAVIGAGGYVTGPVLLMAKFCGVPTMVMESNALPGFTNRQLARFVDRAALTFAESLKFFPAQGVVTGNPVRSEFFDVKPRARTGAPLALLIFGGSQGSRAINNALLDALPLLKPHADRLRITHQTGDADFDTVTSGYAQAGWNGADVKRYIDDMVATIAQTDLVLCRAGATSCAELAAAGKAAVMIPLPTAADDHQRKNAEALERAGAARMLLQRDLTGTTLADVVIELLTDTAKIDAMESASRKLAHRDAAKLTVDLIEEIVRKGAKRTKD